jgi:hypothetical protein
MWAPVAFANFYEVYYSKTDNSASATKLADDSDGISATITGLDHDTTYYVWVKAKARYSNFTSGFSPSANGTTEEKPDMPTASDGLMILQANGYGNNNNATTGSGFPYSAIELYNNSDAEIDFDTDDYYLHIGGVDGGTFSWSDAIKLTGKVPAKHSYLIVSTTDASTTIYRAELPTGDMELDFTISNNGFSIAIMKDTDSLDDEENPFTNDSFLENYVDMLGVGSAAVGFEGSAFTNQSRPRVPRRNSLTDTNNNAADFTDVDYRGSNATAPSNSELYKVWPRSTALGAWDPITGSPEVSVTPWSAD